MILLFRPLVGKKKLFLFFFTILSVLSVLQSMAQAPVITSFSPSSGPVGTSVTITGSNFSATAGDNIVYFGAVKTAVTSATSTSLTVTIPPGTTYKPFTVTTNHLTAWSPKPFLTTFAGGDAPFTPGSFSPATDVTTNLHPNGVVIIDLDGDGIPDLATSNNANSPASLITVCRNTSSGGVLSFANKIDFAAPSGSLPNSIAAEDIDGDGLPDLVVTNNVSSTVSVYRNTSTPGRISLAARVEFATGNAPWSVAIGDLNDDGKPELAVTNFLSNTVSVFKNTGTTGTIAFAPKTDLTTGLSPHTVAISDLDGDGKPDLAVTNTLSSSVSLFRNQSSNGTIIFATRTDITTGTDEPSGIAIGDLDGDNKPDLIITNDNFNLTTAATVSMSVWSNMSSSGNFFFTSKSNYGSEDSYNVSLGDLNGDGKLEVIVAKSASRVLVYQNTSATGNILLTSPVTYYSNSPYSTAIGDLDGDDMPDLAVANFTFQTVSVLQNKVTYPAIVSFTPTIAVTGTTVTIDGANFTGATAVSFGGVPATSFTVMSPTSITAVVGAGASGDVTVTTPKGTAVLAGFTYTVSPTVTSFTPDSAGTGTTVTITGTHLTDATAVSFGGVPATSFTVESPTTITAVVGGGASGDVAVTTAGGQGALPGFYYSGPSIASFTPTSGTSGTTITITGSNFTDATAVSFGGVAAASFTVLSPTTITAVLGPGNPGNVSVTTGQGTGTLPGFMYTGPIISSFSPVAGNAGTVVTIRGLNFTGTTSVSFGGTPAASFSVISPSVITAVVNSGTSGVVAVTTSTGPGTRDGFTFSTTLPIIASVNPSAGMIGDRVIITGSNFSSNASDNIVYFGAVKATVSAATNTSLTVTVPAGATYCPVSVTTNNLTAYDSRPFMPTFAGNGAGLTPEAFPVKLDFPTAENDQAVTLSDLDGDGKSDIVVTNVHGSVYVLQNNSSNGMPSFAPKIDHVTGSYMTTSITAGDLDGDGNSDLIAAGVNPDNISIFRNQSIPGNISFADSIPLPVGHGPFSASLGDLDGDGKPDMVVADMYANLLTIFRNTSMPGNISFDPGKEFSTGQYPAQVIITDLNGDGRSDLAVANSGSFSVSSNIISVFRNTSIGSAISFDNRVDLQTGINPRAIAAGDLDSDGKPELAVANKDNSTVSIFRNNSTGSDILFSPRIDYAAGTTPCDVAIGDLDGDGKPDLAVANQYTGTISAYKNTSAPGAVSFNAKIDYGSVLYGPRSIAIGDLDGDGKPELAVLNGTYVSVLKNKVNDPSPVITTSGGTTVCQGSHVALTSSAVNTQWYKDGAPIDGETNTMLAAATSGVYTATTTVDGVVYQSFNAITVTVHPNPPQPSITWDADNRMLVSSSATGNQWYGNFYSEIAGATGQSYKPGYNPAAASKYFVKVSENGCSSPFSDVYNYVITAIIDLGGNGRYLKIAPNPVHDFVRLTFNFPGVNTLGVELSDINGRVILTHKNLYSNDILNVSDLAAGIYFLKVYSSNRKINVTTSILKR